MGNHRGGMFSPKKVPQFSPRDFFWTKRSLINFVNHLLYFIIDLALSARSLESASPMAAALS
jgi:hypothetical protein